MRALSLCSGVGMLDLAAEQAGITIIGQVEIDEWCRAVLAHHWPHVKRMTDIREVQGDEFGAIDILFGGIPCQPFSSSGKQRGVEDDRHIWPEVARIIATVRPRWLVIENVAQFIAVVLDDLSADLEALGYEVGAAILPACALDASHVRERAVVLAYSDSQQRDLRAGLSDGWASLSEPTSRADARGCRANVADANSSRRGQDERHIHARQCDPAGSGESVEYANGEQLEGCVSPSSMRETRRSAWGSAQESASGLFEPGLGGATTRAASGMDRYPNPTYQSEAQAEWEQSRTVAKRGANHARRLKALGNGVYVPLWREIFLTVVAADMEAQQNEATA